jgi:hypothetical protein
MQRRLHKAFVKVSDAEWHRFKAQCMQRDVTIQAALSELVLREIGASTRRALQAQRLGAT